MTKRGEFRWAIKEWQWLLVAFVHSSHVLGNSPVSIDINFPHKCAHNCLSFPGVFADMGSAMACATPYMNDCYCATAPSSASKAASFITSCVSASCAGGDQSGDLSGLESIYASYCINAGYLQPGVTNWYNTATLTSATTSSGGPSPTGTPNGPATSTTTQLTVTTQTVSSTGTGKPSTPVGKFFVSLVILLALQWTMVLSHLLSCSQ
jgi:hypothetical protein